MTVPPTSRGGNPLQRDSLDASRLHSPEGEEASVAHHIADATRAARLALSALHRLLPAPNALERLTDTGDKGCRSHARLKRHDGSEVYWPTDKLPSGGYRSLCDFCRREVTASRQEWLDAHPGQPVPKDDRRFWPAERMVAAHHEQGHGRFTEAQRASFRLYPNLPPPAAPAPKATTKKAKKAERKAAATSCPTPHRVSYRRKGLAMRVARPARLDVYECRCGQWHVTSQAKTRTA